MNFGAASPTTEPAVKSANQKKNRTPASIEQIQLTKLMAEAIAYGFDAKRTPRVGGWTAEDITSVLGDRHLISDGAVRKRFQRLRSYDDPWRPNPVIFKKLLDAWFGPEDADKRQEFEQAYRRSQPARVRQSGSRSVRQRIENQDIHLRFHNALKSDDFTFYIASMLDARDPSPYCDPENVRFYLRKLYLVRRENRTGNCLPLQNFGQGRIAHTALRLVDGQLHFFCNMKMTPDSFAMRGWMYKFNLGGRPLSVVQIFDDKNWGWSPWIDDQGRVHHGDSGGGSKYRIGAEEIAGKTWADATEQHMRWTSETCPYAVLQAGRGGYLQFITLPLGELPLFEI
jgi:hypothetical protein